MDKSIRTLPIFPYVFSYKTTIFQKLILKSIHTRFRKSIKTEFYVVLLYNLKIIFYDKHFDNIQAKHTTELISFEIQCFDRTFVDRLFKCV
jgi:hypothetical protein